MKFVTLIVQHFRDSELDFWSIHGVITPSTNDLEHMVLLIRTICDKRATIQIVLNIDEPTIGDTDGGSNALPMQVDILVGHINILVKMREQLKLRKLQCLLLLPS